MISISSAVDRVLRQNVSFLAIALVTGQIVLNLLVVFGGVHLGKELVRSYVMTVVDNAESYGNQVFLQRQGEMLISTLNQHLPLQFSGQVEKESRLIFDSSDVSTSQPRWVYEDTFSVNSSTYKLTLIVSLLKLLKWNVFVLVLIALGSIGLAFLQKRILNRRLKAIVDDLLEVVSFVEGHSNSAQARLAGHRIQSDITEIRRLSDAVQIFIQTISDQKERIRDLSYAEAFNNISKQVSHDIRSPLSALSMVVASLKDLPEEKRLIIRNAAQRINDIANQLLHKNKILSPAKSEVEAINLVKEPVLLVGLLDSIVSEKRVQFREQMEIDIQGDLNEGYDLFVSINSTEFYRAISNLINNSVEALQSSGRVTVCIQRYNEQVQVLIVDNGKGIPEHILARLGERGVTYGKDTSHSSGSGLGVYHARQTVESAGGSFAIQSQIDVGTTIILSLPKSDTPKWFAEKISLPFGSTVISADDDQTIHQIWSGRLSSCGSESSGIKHLTFSSCELFENWVSENHDHATVFLIDYEFLGQARNGLDVIERTGIGNKAVLVTSRYEEPHIRLRASSLGVRILPKSLAPFVPIYFESKLEKYHAVLIDDDELVRMTWRMAAKEQGKDLVCFSDPSEFFAVASKIHPSTPLYVDVSLGNGIRGEDVAQRASNLGFTEIRLATGYEASALQVPSCVRGVISKDPVFKKI